MIIGVYVDDLIITGASEAKVKEFKKTVMRIFEMTDWGLLYFIWAFKCIKVSPK